MHKIATCLTSLCLFIFAFILANAGENDFTSAIVVNSKNGKILYSYNADKQIYPASLTKMMTTYIVFEKITQGAIGLYDKVDRNKYSSSQFAQLFNTQDSITIYDLLIKTIVKSNNLPAEILALEIYGNTKSFVDEMNKKAKKFGMLNTHFANTHGLYNEKHYSTARDMANLSIRLVNDFPEYAELFNITEYINDSDDIEEKTSTIQKNIKGIKGSKTGYISASGYNIVMWGVYENNTDRPDSIFAVLIGAKSKQQRDELILKLLNATIKNEFATSNHKQNDNYDIAKILAFLGIKPEIYTANQPKMRATNTDKYKYFNLENDEFEGLEDIDKIAEQSYELPTENESNDEKKDLSNNILVQNRDKILTEDTAKQPQNFDLSVKPNTKKKNRFYIAR